MKKNLIWKGLVNTLGIAVYIAIVVGIINGIGQFPAKAPTFLGPVAILLLLVLSATITGFLFLGEPILLYLDNKKKESARLFLSTIGWMVLLFVLILLIILVGYSG